MTAPINASLKSFSETLGQLRQEWPELTKKIDLLFTEVKPSFLAQKLHFSDLYDSYYDLHTKIGLITLAVKTTQNDAFCSKWNDVLQKVEQAAVIVHRKGAPPLQLQLSGHQELLRETFLPNIEHVQHLDDRAIEQIDKIWKMIANSSIGKEPLKLFCASTRTHLFAAKNREQEIIGFLLCSYTKIPSEQSDKRIVHIWNFVRRPDYPFQQIGKRLSQACETYLQCAYTHPPLDYITAFTRKGNPSVQSTCQKLNLNCVESEQAHDLETDWRVLDLQNKDTTLPDRTVVSSCLNNDLKAAAGDAPHLFYFYLSRFLFRSFWNKLRYR